MSASCLCLSTSVCVGVCMCVMCVSYMSYVCHTCSALLLVEPANRKSSSSFPEPEQRPLVHGSSELGSSSQAGGSPGLELLELVAALNIGTQSINGERQSSRHSVIKWREALSQAMEGGRNRGTQ